MSRPALLLLSACLVSALSGSGCDDSTGTRSHSLSTLWPNEDGRRWDYELTAKGWAPDLFDSSYTFADSSAVPGTPGFAEIIPLIDNPPQPDTSSTLSTSYAMAFRGMITTDLIDSDDPGVTVQNLLESEGGVENPFPCVEQTNPFLVLLATARPDLRSRLGVSPLALSKPRQSAANVDTEHYLIHGGPWEMTEDWIGQYGCIDTLLAWEFLDADTSPGSQFTLQLIPSLADNVFLHARVRRHINIATAVGFVTNALDVVYILDYGLSQATDEGSPDPDGFFHIISYGNVLYAPRIGPVYSYERNLVPIGENKIGLGIGEVVLEIQEVTPGD